MKPPVVNPLSVELRSEIFGILNNEWAKVLSGEIPVGQFVENTRTPINALLQGRSTKSGK